jgi:ATP-binding cassette subfamily B protein
LIKLLTRLYAPTEGRILVDGLDLQEWDTNAIREKNWCDLSGLCPLSIKPSVKISASAMSIISTMATRLRKRRGKGMADEFVRDLPLD